MHDLTHAVSDLTCCLELVPEYVRAYCARGLARAEQGEREAAQNDLGRALALSPEYTRAILKQNQKTLESEHVWPVVPVGASKGK
jgi:regulator of sirC expression with transglutaminase-like and TPR domain